MNTALVIATVVLYALSAIHYVRLTLQKRINPVPATWILMFSMFVLANWMYWHSQNRSLSGNIANTAGLLNVAIILGGVVFRHLRDKSWSTAFNPVQKTCLGLGMAVATFWYFNREHSDLAYYMTQTIALIAYIPTVVRLSKAKSSTEPISLWLCVLLACITAIGPAVAKHDLKGYVYIARALPSTAIVLFLILRLKIKNKQLNPAG